ncbi:Cro/CI family transcriptional regulator [Methylibium sp.]|uniref:Cro/CI family transcriptional regulator n=1 Tax=Methylibium sp. TaxID=2067992 RepID=UPI003D11B113
MSEPTHSELIDELGGPTALARLLGVKAPSVHEWRKRGVPSAHGPAIERATKGARRCEALWPDVNWQRVADAAWPWHPDGKPLIDVLPAEVEQASTEGA